MNVAQLIRQATAKGIPAFHVSIPDGDAPDVPRLEGTLKEFWAAAKTLKAKAVFIQARQLDEDDFEVELPEDCVPWYGPDDDSSFDGDNYSVAVEKVSPAISSYRKFLGEDCAFVLTAKGGVAELEFLVTEDWWEEFNDESDKAVDVWLDRRERAEGKAAAGREKRTAKRLGSPSPLLS